MISRLGKILKKSKLSIVTAESCTGGGVSYLISKNKECSSQLERGYITYSNQSKEQMLGVTAESLQLHGAVSKEVAFEMAKGALKKSNGQISVAITGIAAEDNDDKLGIAWVCFMTNTEKHHIFKLEIPGTRNAFIKTIINSTIKELISFLKNNA